MFDAFYGVIRSSGCFLSLWREKGNYEGVLISSTDLMPIIQALEQKKLDLNLRDELPDNREKAELFKNHIYALQSLDSFSKAIIKIRRRDIGFK